MVSSKESIIQIFSLLEALKDKKLKLLPLVIKEQKLDVLLRESMRAHNRLSFANQGR